MHFSFFTKTYDRVLKACSDNSNIWHLVGFVDFSSLWKWITLLLSLLLCVRLFWIISLELWILCCEDSVIHFLLLKNVDVFVLAGSWLDLHEARSFTLCGQKSIPQFPHKSLWEAHVVQRLTRQVGCSWAEFGDSSPVLSLQHAPILWQPATAAWASYSSFSSSSKTDFLSEF